MTYKHDNTEHDTPDAYGEWDLAKCRRLWAAVLQRGVRDATGDVRGSGTSQTVSNVMRLREEALDWVFSDRGSFLWVCDRLEIMPETVRAYVRRNQGLVIRKNKYK